MIDAGIEAEFLGHVTAFLWPSGDADGVGPLDAGDLADYRADRTRSCRDHHGLARDRFADLKQPHVSGHSGHSENAQRSLHRCSRWIDFLHAGAVGQSMSLPAGTAYDDIAYGELRDVRSNYFADRAALHHIADANRLGIGRRIAHPAAHVGVERKPQRAQQHLVRSGLWDRKLFRTKII